MAGKQLRLRPGWWRTVLTEPTVGKAVGDKARRIATASGSGYVAETSEGQKRHTRHRAAVIATTRRAIRDNARDNTLLRNADA